MRTGGAALRPHIPQEMPRAKRKYLGEKKIESCPYRCHLSIPNTFVDDADNSEQQEPNQDFVEEDEGRGMDID